MKKKYCLVVFILLAACQKGIEPFDGETGPPGTAALNGTWNFVSLTATTQVIQEYIEDNINYSTTTSSDYTTINNGGTITFTDSDFTSQNISYSIDTEFVGYSYENGVLTDSIHLPFQITIDSSNSTGKYKLIGNDSIAFPEGGFISVDGSEPAQAPPSGGKYNISGNILTITQKLYSDTIQNYLGVPLHTTESGTFITKLQKQ
jgi:hypothetical protein